MVTIAAAVAVAVVTGAMVTGGGGSGVGWCDGAQSVRLLED